MGLFDNLSSSNSRDLDQNRFGLIDYGKSKSDGSHDHRTNKGKDRTPSQKEADKQKRKP